MAVNTHDELQFLSFIFAVLLSITVHFTALRQQHTKILLIWVQISFRDNMIFFDFTDGDWPPC